MFNERERERGVGGDRMLKFKKILKEKYIYIFVNKKLIANFARRGGTYLLFVNSRTRYNQSTSMSAFGSMLTCANKYFQTSSISATKRDNAKMNSARFEGINRDVDFQARNTPRYSILSKSWLRNGSRGNIVGNVGNATRSERHSRINASTPI